MISRKKSKRDNDIPFVRNYITIIATICLINILISNHVIDNNRDNAGSNRCEKNFALQQLPTSPILSPHSTSNNETLITGGSRDRATRNLSQSLPIWIQEYMSWHRHMRSQYPGQAILTDPNAPPVLVRICLGLCGGLHDRLGQLPLDLYIANQTRRILLIKWIKPHSLEEFLVPSLSSTSTLDHGIDWTFPLGVPGWGTGCNTLNECAKQVRSQPQIPGNIAETRLDSNTSFETLLDQGIDLLNGKMKKIKAVTFQIMGHLSEDVLERKLQQLGETDMIHTTSTFGTLFHTFFQPHPNIQKEITSIRQQYNLIPGTYTVAHVRVRHPKAYNKGMRFNNEFVSNADKLGLPFEGHFRDLAIRMASRAIACAATLPGVASQPIYFMADESELVRFVTRDLVNATTAALNPSLHHHDNNDNVNETARYVMFKYNVVARDQNVKNAHIDKNKGRPPEDYYGTFVDLYLGIEARCVAFGIGNYAMFATKISGTKCKIRYAREIWGVEYTTHKEETRDCSLPE